MPLEWSQPLTLTLLVNCAALPAILDVSLHPSMEGHYFIENHYLHQLRKAAGEWRATTLRQFYDRGPFTLAHFGEGIAQHKKNVKQIHYLSDKKRDRKNST